MLIIILLLIILIIIINAVLIQRNSHLITAIVCPLCLESHTKQNIANVSAYTSSTNDIKARTSTVWQAKVKCECCAGTAEIISPNASADINVQPFFFLGSKSIKLNYQKEQKKKKKSETEIVFPIETADKAQASISTEPLRWPGGYFINKAWKWINIFCKTRDSGEGWGLRVLEVSLGKTS